MKYTRRFRWNTFDRKLEKLNRNYRCCARNALYLYLHPEDGEQINCGQLFSYMKEKQSDQTVRFDWVFLNCGKKIQICNFQKDILENIPLEKEFDWHDTPEAKYIVLLDDGYPFGTCRMFAAENGMAEIGCVVVLEQYRGKGFGSLLILEAERWLKALGFSRVCVESRDVAVGFYEKLGYIVMGQPVAGDTFLCVHMEKELHGL